MSQSAMSGIGSDEFCCSLPWMPWTDKLNSPLNTVKMHIGHTSSSFSSSNSHAITIAFVAHTQLNLTALAPIRPYQSVYKEIKGIL